MLVNLPNGKTVDMSFDEYLRMGREGYQYLMANSLGTYVEHPFYSSALQNKSWRDAKETVEEEEEEEEEEEDNSLPLENFEE
jgi:hypothetical protein